MGPSRRVARIVAASLVVVAGLPVALVCHAVSRQSRARVTGGWSRLLLRALGVRLEIVLDEPDPAGPGTAAGTPQAAQPQGEPPVEEPPVGELLVANHVSWLDPLVLAAVVPSRPLAKREIAGWPVARTLAAGAGALFIDRERLDRLPSAVAAVAGALAEGDTVVAFPEGTTWCGPGMGGFRPAVFQAAIDADANVRPATVRYLEGAAPSTRAAFVGDDTLLASALRVVATRGLVAEVRLLDPVRPRAWRPSSGVPDPRARAALAGLVEARVRTGLGVRRPGEGV